MNVGDVRAKSRRNIDVLGTFKNIKGLNSADNERKNAHGTTDGKNDRDHPPTTSLAPWVVHLSWHSFGSSTLGTACCSSGKSVKLTALRESSQIMRPVNSM